MMNILWWLIVAHAVCDFPLQGDFLARGKNHRAPLAGVPWIVCLFAHSLIHGGAVALVTGNVLLGAAETAAHAWLDWAKCDGRYGFAVDQGLHILSKCVWILVLIPLR